MLPKFCVELVARNTKKYGPSDSVSKTLKFKFTRSPERLFKPNSIVSATSASNESPTPTMPAAAAEAPTPV